MPPAKSAAPIKRNIIDRASELLKVTLSKSTVPIKPKDNVTIDYRAADKMEARAIAAAIIYANTVGPAAYANVVKPLDLLLPEYKFAYNESKHKGSITIASHTVHGKHWSDPAKEMIAALKKLKLNYRMVGKEPEHQYFKQSHAKTYEIYPHKPQAANFPVHLQVQLMGILSKYHGYDVKWQIVDLPPHLLPRPGGHVDLQAVRSYLKKDQNGADPSDSSDMTMREYNEGRHREEEEQRRIAALKDAKRQTDDAREAQPASLKQLEEGFKNLRKPRVKDNEEARLLTHAAEAFAKALDVRNLETLAKADYDLTIFADQAEKTQLHRQVAEMLLSDDNMYTAATNAKLGAIYDPERARHEMTPRMKIDHDRKVEKNRQFLRDHPDAVKLIEEQSFRIPGLVFLLQAATLPLAEGKLQAGQAWKRRRNQTAESLIKKEPQHWQGTVSNLLDACCRGSAKSI